MEDKFGRIRKHVWPCICGDTHVLRLPISEGCLAAMWKAEDKYSHHLMRARDESWRASSTLSGSYHAQVLNHYQGNSEGCLVTRGQTYLPLARSWRGYESELANLLSF